VASPGASGSPAPSRLDTSETCFFSSLMTSLLL
jgi:hypothetical protein